MGIIIADRQPSSVPAHCTPKFTNICFENRGKHAPTADRKIVFAANTDAALRRYRPLAEIAIAWRDMQGSIWGGKLTIADKSRSDN